MERWIKKSDKYEYVWLYMNIYIWPWKMKLSFTGKWVELKIIVLSKISQIEMSFGYFPLYVESKRIEKEESKRIEVEKEIEKRKKKRTWK